MSAARKRAHIFIISDATGTTAEMVIQAVMVQFRALKPVFKRFPYIKTKEQITAILDQAHEVQGIVIYSLVSPDLRAWIRREKRALDIYTIDLLGPILDRIRKQWNLMPLLEPGLLRGIDEESLRVAEAIDFTLKHDDGQGAATLGKADLIILGISRTSKTPTSLYLACNYGMKVANVPLILGIDPPDKIFSLKTPKVGLTIDLERLAFIRKKRLKHRSELDYTDVSHIRSELDYSDGIYRRLDGLQVIDVSHSSIEEIAGRIVEERNERRRAAS